MDYGNHSKHETKVSIHICSLKVSKGLYQTPTFMSNIINGEFIILVIYVDDGIVINNKFNLIHYIIFSLKEEFEIIHEGDLCNLFLELRYFTIVNKVGFCSFKLNI
jgi:hypothetical protein